MQLYEFEAKAMLARHGVRVPRGGLWPQVPAGLRYPAAVKAQTLAGGRGRRGGVRQVESPAGVGDAVAAVQRMRFDGEPVAEVLVEEWIETEREFYLALTIDRTRSSPLLLASAKGGMEVEDAGDLCRLPIDPWIAPRAHHIRRLGALYGLEAERVAAVVEGAWKAFCALDALLVEINPLGVDRGELIALDARIFVDDNAGYRHPDWPAARGGTPFERGCAGLGATAVEMEDGDVALITSGAGLGMASLDLLVAMGGRPRVLVDLGPVVFQQPEKIAQLIELLAALRPRVILFNFFLQLAACDRLAQGLSAGLVHLPSDAKMVVRMKGVRSDEARAILAPAGIPLYDDLAEGFRAAIAATGA
ncbi:MAG: hypothetical protein HY660_05545 [Armatimonadetes bacterium]|nr:hypothetical protein [Armatimonadota bacterium]